MMICSATCWPKSFERATRRRGGGLGWKHWPGYFGRGAGFDQLDDWFLALEPPARVEGVSMLDGYLTAIIIGPRSIPPDEWFDDLFGARGNIAVASGTMLAAITSIVVVVRHGRALQGGERCGVAADRADSDGAQFLDRRAQKPIAAMQRYLKRRPCRLLIFRPAASSAAHVSNMTVCAE